MKESTAPLPDAPALYIIHPNRPTIPFQTMQSINGPSLPLRLAAFRIVVWGWITLGQGGDRSISSPSRVCKCSPGASESEPERVPHQRKKALLRPWLISCADDGPKRGRPSTMRSINALRGGIARHAVVCVVHHYVQKVSQCRDTSHFNQTASASCFRSNWEREGTTAPTRSSCDSCPTHAYVPHGVLAQEGGHACPLCHITGLWMASID